MNFEMKDLEKNNQIDFYKKVSNLLKEARESVVRTVNNTMVYTYLEIGRMIIEEEQNGNERAEYGKQILKELSNRLITEFGKGFSVTNLQQMKNFYNIYGKQQTVSAKSENGIILCKDKKDTLVEITLPENNEQIFASKYQMILPSKKELKQLIENKEIE
jgi:predicted GNAT family N-acyltransferase